MLPEEENKLLMETGPGTMMGELLRRYWMPIAAVAELDDMPIKPVRLMCEDLVIRNVTALNDTTPHPRGCVVPAQWCHDIPSDASIVNKSG